MKSFSIPFGVIYCGDFQLGLIVNSTHDFIIFPSPLASEKCIVRFGGPAIASEPVNICRAVLWE